MPRAGLDADAVVDAAATIADTEGLDGLRLAGVAEALGVRAPSLYAHVDGLDDLRRRLGARGARGLAAALREASIGRSRGEALRAAARAYRRYAREHPGAYAAAQRPPDPGDADAIAAADEAVEVLAALLAGYGLRGSDAIHAIRAVRSALHGFVALEAAGGFARPESIEETFNRLVEMLDNGLDRSPRA